MKLKGLFLSLATLVLVMLILPVFVNALVYLTPSRFEPAEPLQSGRPYLANFYLTNKDENPIPVFAEIDCFPVKNRSCASAEWFQIINNDFILGPKETKQIQVRIMIPANSREGTYQNALLVSSQSTNQQGQTKMMLSLASLIRFEKKGDLNWLQRLYYSFQHKYQTASMGSVGLKSVMLWLFALAGGFFLIKEMFFRLKRRH